MRTLLFIFLIFICKDLKASPQRPDYLIIGKDTSLIYFLPLHHLDTLTLNTFFDNLKSDKAGFVYSLNLWRGYQAYWEIIDNKLFLVGLKGYKQTDEILKKNIP